MDKKEYKVAVVIVTYNAGQTLQACLNSIYSQSANHAIEIIVMDGLSTDRTPAILKENNDKIACWKSEKDTGIYDAMNKALKFITAKRVLFLGADDMLLPDFSAMLASLKNPQTIYYANVIYKNARHSGYITPYYQAKSGIFHQSIIYPASLFKKYTYNAQYKIAADYALNMKCHKDPEFHFEYVDYTIAQYNDTGISSNTVDIEFEKDKSKLILDNFGLKIWLRYLFKRMKAKIKSI